MFHTAVCEQRGQRVKNLHDPVAYDDLALRCHDHTEHARDFFELLHTRRAAVPERKAQSCRAVLEMRDIGCSTDTG